MTAVRQWTGEETKALRAALRLSIRAFAEKLGIGIRTVTTWEARGAGVRLRPSMASIMDTVLERASDEVRDRFVLILRSPTETRTSSAAHDPGRSRCWMLDGALSAPTP